MGTTIVTSEKEIAKQKENVIAKRKESIKGQTNKVKNLIDLDLDSLDAKNLKDLISKSNLKVDREVNAKFQMYKFERENLTDKEEKKQRTKMRKQRNKLVDNIIYFFSVDKAKELIAEIKSFREFYLKEYTLNDYSIKSLASDNSDKETLEKIKIMLSIIALDNKKK